MKIDLELEQKILKTLNGYAISGDSIQPSVKMDEAHAYEFTSFSESLNETEVITQSVLVELYERKYLTRHIYDRVFVCGSCDHWQINLREVCPSCRSLDWQKKMLYHHFSCGYVGLESEFKSTSFDELHCPKCEQVLRHIGLDYEKPSQSFYCHSCTHIFEEHMNEGSCFNCGNITDLSDLKNVHIYSYSLTSKAYQAIEKNSLQEANLEDVLLDKMSGVWSYDYFAYYLESQRAIAQECEDSLSVLIVETEAIGNFCAYAKKVLNPSFAISKYKNICFIAATRKSTSDQKAQLKKVIDDYHKHSDSPYMSSLFCVELEKEVEGQLSYYLDQNGLSFKEKPEGGFCEY
jgi:rubrerythrin